MMMKVIHVGTVGVGFMIFDWEWFLFCFPELMQVQ